MKWEDHYRYLGCEVGRDPRAETKAAGDRYRKEAEKMLGSLLMDWQKLDAMRRFIRSKLEYILRTMLPNCSWVKNLDDVVRGMVKKPSNFNVGQSHLSFMCRGSTEDWGSPMSRATLTLGGLHRCTSA